MSAIDHKGLLQKYMDWVEILEGTDFVNKMPTGTDFTPEDLAELRRLSDENHSAHAKVSTPKSPKQKNISR